LQREVDDLRRRLDELRAGRDRFRDLVESTSDWLWEVDCEGKYTYVSPQVRDVLGREVDDLIGTTPFDIMPAAEAERLKAIFQNFVSRAEPFEHIENVCLHADGREVVMETSGVPVHGQDGDLKGYRGVDRDITARKRAEESLGEERLRARVYLNLAGVIFVAMDAAGTVTLVNQKACEVLGYTKEQIIGRNWFDTCLPPRLKETVKDVARQVLSGDIEPVEYYENPVLTRSGAERIIAWHNTTLRDDSGSIIGTLSSGQDITERKEAEEALRDSEQQSRSLIETAPNIILHLAPDHKILEFNPEAERVFGRSRKEVLGMDYLELFVPESERANVAADIQKVLSGEPTRGYENSLMGADGAEYTYSWNVNRLMDAQDRPSGIIAIGQDITERKRTEQALRKSEAVLNAAGRMANVGGWELVPETMEVRWTDQIYHIYGLPVGQMPPLEENLGFYHPGDRPRLITGLQRAIDHGEPYDLELRFTTAQGRDLWVHTMCRPVVENGKTVLLQGTFQDITERKQAKEALLASEEKYRTLVSHTPAVLWTSDENGHTSFISSNVEQVYGYTPKEILKAGDRLWFGRIHREDLESVKAEYEAMIERGKPFDVEYRIQRQDGDWIWLHDRATRSHEIEGKLRVDGVFLDVTKRKLAEEELHQYEHIVSNATDMLALVDQHYVYLAANAAYLQAFDKTSDEVIGRTVAEVFGEEFFSTVIKPRAERCLAGEHIRYQDWFDFPVAGRKYMDIAYSPYLGPDTDPWGFVVAGRDITRQKQAEEERDNLEEQLRQAQKMEAVGQLAGGIAHDFNNILTAVMGNAEMLKMDLPAESKQETFTDEIIRGAARAAALTRQLLAFARKGKRQVTPVDIHNIVHQTVKMLTHSIDRRIEIHLELHASESTVMGDPAQLQNALLNLGVNARDAMGDGGTLTYATGDVTLSKTECDKHPYELTPGNFLEIRITNTGIGMDRQTQERIFEPFFTTKEVGKGTGLGLAGVYGCVRSHDGSVSVSSQPGRGTTFTILLPLADTGASATERTVSADEPVRGTGHVLIVDDEESVRSFVRTSLQNLGYTVSVCPDGAAGADYYREHHREIDLVILDLIMPRMSGQDAFGEMKRINPDVRVLLSAGFSHTQATRQMLDEGALGLLNKPFQITELAQAIAEHIQNN